MEHNPDASESDAARTPLSAVFRDGPTPLHSAPHVVQHHRPIRRPLQAARLCCFGLATLVLASVCPGARADDSLERVRASGLLRYGSDMEGGGPYAYPDPQAPRSVTGFEVELMAQVAKDLGAKAELSQGQWDKLLQVLDAGRIDLVCNGYEWTEARAQNYLATRPYYVYQLQLMTRRGSAYRVLG